MLWNPIIPFASLMNVWCAVSDLFISSVLGFLEGDAPPLHGHWGVGCFFWAPIEGCLMLFLLVGCPFSSAGEGPQKRSQIHTLQTVPKSWVLGALLSDAPTGTGSPLPPRAPNPAWGSISLYGSQEPNGHYLSPPPLPFIVCPTDSPSLFLPGHCPMSKVLLSVFPPI